MQKNKSTLSYFKSSFIFCLAGTLLAGYLGYSENGSTATMLQFIFLISILALLEVTISFDNAIVDASVLKNMTPLWQKRFLTWGIFIAVFGMRLIFPIVIVCLSAWMGPIDAIRMAIFDRAQYASIMLSVHSQVAAFGGSFLALVCLSYFFDHEKDVHWIGFLEKHLSKLGALKSTEVAIVLAGLWLFSGALDEAHSLGVLKAGVAGVITFLGVKLLGDVLSIPDGTQKDLQRQSLGLFLYIEVLDASFSFDGVVAAFAITVNPFLIAIGLGIGAMFVRSFVILMVEKGALDTFKYLEQGAFWAIGILSIMMFLGISHEIPEALTGGLGLMVIGAAFFHSLQVIKRT